MTADNTVSENSNEVSLIEETVAKSLHTDFWEKLVFPRWLVQADRQRLPFTLVSEYRMDFT